nr:hypothetical protein [Tanacetum cinerariifolium]
MIVAQEVGEGDADQVHVEDVNDAGVIAERVASIARDAVNAVVDEQSIPSYTPPTPPPQPSQDIPTTSQKFNSNVAFLLKTKEQIDEEEIRAFKRLNESQDDKTAKKQKLDEEVKELKRHLQIVYTSLNLEKSKKCLWSSEGQELEAVRVLWCADYHIYYNIVDFAGRRYPLTRFTLDQMLNNVRLEVEEESEGSLELLRFIRQQHQEGVQQE